MKSATGYGLAKVLQYLPKFLRYVFRHFPSARAAVAVSAGAVIFEYAALSVMVPLAGSVGSSGGSGSGGGALALKLWSVVATAMDLPSGPRTWLWLFLLLLGGRIAIGFAQLAVNTWVSKSILARLSGGTFARVITEEPLAEIYRRTVGHYTAMAGDESVRVGQVFFHLAQAVSAVVAALVGLLILFFFSLLVFNLTLVFLVLSALAIGLAVKRTFRWSNEATLLSREANTTFIEAFNGIRSIRSMAGEQFVAQRYRRFIDRYARVLFYLDLFNQGSRSLPGLILIAVGLVALFPSAGYFHELSIVYFFTVTTMLMRILASLGTAVASGGRAAIDIRAAFDIDDILGQSPRRGGERADTVVTGVSSITFCNLSCGYLPGQAVLSDISGALHAGRCYALVGRSGSGKSTLSDVLLGHLPPQSGRLRIDGVAYDQIDMASLRRRVVLVEQQTRIFSGTVRENIAFGWLPTDAQMQLAVRAAALEEFVTALPDGLETQLDYQGANLSGGQRQRIGLARAIIRQPDVLILDEATSALDGQTRDALLKDLRELFKDGILVFITHDNNIIKTMDEVWHIKKGSLMVEIRDAVA